MPGPSAAVAGTGPSGCLRAGCLVTRADIAADPRLELTEPQVLQLALQVARLDGERPDAPDGLERIPVQVSRVHQQTDRQALPVGLQDVLVAGNRAARDLGLGEAV